VYVELGGAEPGAWAKAKATATRLPSNHSPLFAPDLAPALQTGIASEVTAIRYFFASPPRPSK
jgi:hippurate hydrolase